MTWLIRFESFTYYSTTEFIATITEEHRTNVLFYLLINDLYLNDNQNLSTWSWCADGKSFDA